MSVHMHVRMCVYAENTMYSLIASFNHMKASVGDKIRLGLFVGTCKAIVSHTMHVSPQYIQPC